MTNQLFFLFWSSFVVGLSGAVMPGPVLTATIREATRRGLIAGPLIVLGHASLEILVVAAVAGGLGPWLQRDPVLGTLGLAGGTLLLGMGALTVRSSGSASLAAAVPDRAPRSLHGPVITGILTTLSNPYWWLWWATIGLSYVALSKAAGAGGLVSFYLGHILADLAWFTLVAAAVAAGRRICPPAVYRWVLVACGMALVGLGAYFFRLGLTKLAG